jgi:hypothetical protein
MFLLTFLLFFLSVTANFVVRRVEAGNPRGGASMAPPDPLTWVEMTGLPVQSAR